MTGELLVTSPWLCEDRLMKPLLEEYGAYLREVSHPTGAAIFEQRDCLTEAFFILSGSVKLVMSDLKGNTRMLCVAASGNMVGIVPAVDQSPSQFGAVALEPVTGWTVPAEMLRELLVNDGQFAAVLFLALCREQRLAVKLLSDAALRGANEQVRCLLHHLSRQASLEDGPVTLSVTQHDLAAVLGVTRVTVAQQIERLKREGILKTGRGKIEVLDREALKCCEDVVYCVVSGTRIDAVE